MNTQRPRIVVLDDYERALRRLADWSEIDRRADVAIYQPVFEAFARGVTECLRAWIVGEPIVRPLKID